MFSSSNNINPYAYFPSLPTHDSGDPIYHHYHHDLLQGHHPLLPFNHPEMNESFLNMTMLNNSTQKVEAFAHDSGFLLPQKKPVKKDRHSKICTAQGIRDRRVRLSTDIAREFFDLQDMLGFDKASQTVGWLLDKSKSAIKELAEMKSGGGGTSTAFSNSTSSECDVVSEDGDLGDTGLISKGKEIVDAKMDQKLQKADIMRLLAKESREKARARARERTRDKMCTRRIHEFNISPETTNQFKKSEVGDHHHGSHLGFGQREDDGFQGSNVMMMIKRKMKACPNLGNQQNAYFSPDFSLSSSDLGHF